MSKSPSMIPKRADAVKGQSRRESENISSWLHLFHFVRWTLRLCSLESSLNLFEKRAMMIWLEIPVNQLDWHVKERKADHAWETNEEKKLSQIFFFHILFERSWAGNIVSSFAWKESRHWLTFLNQRLRMQ